MKQRGLVLALQLAAVWPVWPWYARRIADPSDDAEIGLVALAVAVFLLGRLPQRAPASARALLPAVVANLAYAASYHLLPPLLRAALAFTAVGATLSALWRGRTLPAGLWALLLLSLPVMASLQFYLGYPLRVASGSVAAFLLRLSGWPAVREGAMLRVAEHSVWIDAPCSGVRMLWAAAFLGAAVHHVLDAGWRGRLLMALGLLPTVLLGNAFRALALTQLEITRVDARFLHEVVGAVAFLCTGTLLVRFALWSERRAACTASS